MAQEVGHGIRYQSRRHENIHIATFVVEVDEIGRLEHPAHADARKTTDANKTITANPEDSSTPDANTEHVAVVLNPTEHSKYLWIKEEDVASQDVDGEKLTFTSDDTKTTLLEAFELQKFIIEAKAGI